MKLIDKDGKLFSKISIIDIVIVLVILFIVVSLVFGKTDTPAATKVSKNETNYTLVLKAYGLYKHDREPFSVGDNIYGNNGESIGKVTAITSENTKSNIKLSDGKYVEFSNPQFYDYFLTIEGKGTSTEKGMFASGTLPLIPCNNVTISSKYFNGNSIVLSVEKSA